MTSKTQQSAIPPLSLYVHIPWCIKKCPYCDFNSYAIQGQGQLPETDYVTRLLHNLQQQSPLLQGRKFQSVFIGGGTPSLFSAQSIEQLMQGIQPYLFSPDIEVTLEANPSSSEQERFRGYYLAGVNRISLGVQSLDNISLKQLGRVHNAHEAERAFVMARTAGFDNINVDLMFALPHKTTQSVSHAQNDLKQVIAWQPNHISWYQLTIEPNTYFQKYPPNVPNDDVAWEMQLQGQKLLEKSNYIQYEVSAFAKNNYQSKHNLNYWLFGDYLGIGAGAHSKITHLTTGEIKRSWCWRNPNDYLNPHKNPVAEEKIIPKTELALEFMLNTLRLRQPISITLFEQRTGLTYQDIQPTLQKAEALKLLISDNKTMTVTAHGRQYLNELLELFLI